jgi:hypothetical protein
LISGMRDKWRRRLFRNSSTAKESDMRNMSQPSG